MMVQRRRMREVRRPRDISLKDAFRIDWRNAVREAEEYTDSKMNGDFDDKMKAIQILYDVKFMYSKDDIDGYLKLLDMNRDILKHDQYSQSIGADPEPFDLGITRVL